MDAENPVCKLIAYADVATARAVAQAMIGAWKASGHHRDVGIHSVLASDGQPAVVVFSMRPFDAEIWQIINRHKRPGHDVVDAPEEVRRALWLRRLRQQADGLGKTYQRTEATRPVAVDPFGQEHRQP